MKDGGFDRIERALVRFDRATDRLEAQSERLERRPPPETEMTDPAPITDEDSLVAALKPFGWEGGPEFFRRYYSDQWVFNLANAVERLSAEVERLRIDGSIITATAQELERLRRPVPAAPWSAEDFQAMRDAESDTWSCGSCGYQHEAGDDPKECCQ